MEDDLLAFGEGTSISCDFIHVGKLINNGLCTDQRQTISSPRQLLRCPLTGNGLRTGGVLLGRRHLHQPKETFRRKVPRFAMMGEIFERAEGVLACVGPRANESEMLMQRLRTLDKSSWVSGRTLPDLAFGVRGYWWIIRQRSARSKSD